MEQCNWPEKCGANFLINNRWDYISPSTISYIKQNSHKWETYPSNPTEWMFFSCDIKSRTYIREIFQGHWAWCSELASVPNGKRPRKQYELVAAEYIKKKDWICEYI